MDINDIQATAKSLSSAITTAQKLIKASAAGLVKTRAAIKALKDAEKIDDIEESIQALNDAAVKMSEYQKQQLEIMSTLMNVMSEHLGTTKELLEYLGDMHKSYDSHHKAILFLLDKAKK